MVRIGRQEDGFTPSQRGMVDGLTEDHAWIRETRQDGAMPRLRVEPLLLRVAVTELTTFMPHRFFVSPPRKSLPHLLTSKIAR